MRPSHFIEALMLISDMETMYGSYKYVNRQNMFNFSRFIGRNINLNLIRQRLMERTYQSFDEFLQHLRNVFIQDVQFYSEYSKWFVPLRALDYIQSQLTERPKIDMNRARSILHLFIDKAGQEGTSLRFSPRLFGMQPGLCIATCIMRVETLKYKSIDDLYRDLRRIGKQYTDSVQVEKQSTNLALLCLQMQVDFDLVTVVETKNAQLFAVERERWCSRYMLRYATGKSFNVKYYVEEYIPGLSERPEYECKVEFNKWYRSLGREIKGPEWALYLGSEFDSKQEAFDMFSEAWKREREREDYYFAHWLFSNSSMGSFNDQRHVFREEREEFSEEFNKICSEVSERWRDTEEGSRHTGKGHQSVFKSFLHQEVERESAFTAWTQRTCGGKGTRQDFDMYCKEIDEEVTERKKVANDEEVSNYQLWCTRNGFEGTCGKGLRKAFKLSRNISSDVEEE